MKRPCEHCGVGFLPSATEARYCCGGCRAVATLLAREGLEEFYSRRDAPGQPVGALPKARSAWAKRAQAEAELSHKIMQRVHLRLEVSGMICAGCAWLIESLFERLEGGSRCEVSLTGGYLDLWWERDSGFSLVDFVEKIAVYGYGAKAGNRVGFRTMPASLGYFAMGLIFMVNAGLLAWLNTLSYQEGNAMHPLHGWIECFLYLSLLAGASCWAMLMLRLRALSRSGKTEA